MKTLITNPFVQYLIKFCCLFCIFYFGTLLIIGLSSKENSYSPFVANYFDYITILRNFILNCSDRLLQTFHYTTYREDLFTLGIQGGKSVRVVYSCVGYGVMSFWAAFVLANNGSFEKKAIWFFSGLILLLFLNVLRIFFLILALNARTSYSVGLDHHVIFNIAAYGLIFFLIYIYDRSKSGDTNFDLQ